MSDLTGVVPGPSEIAGLFDWSTALETLRKLGTDVAAARSVADACSAIQQVLAGNPSDIPFAALYLLDDRRHLMRMSATGVVSDGRQLPTSASVDENTGPWPFASVIRTKQSADVSQGVVLPIRGTHERVAQGIYGQDRIDSRRLHGQLVVDSEPQRGTAIRARVPYSGRAS